MKWLVCRVFGHKWQPFWERTVCGVYCTRCNHRTDMLKRASAGE
jgi:hypothetical protein